MVFGYVTYDENSRDIGMKINNIGISQQFHTYFLVREKSFACEITYESTFYMLHFYAYVYIFTLLHHM